MDGVQMEPIPSHRVQKSALLFACALVHLPISQTID